MSSNFSVERTNVIEFTLKVTQFRDFFLFFYSFFPFLDCYGDSQRFSRKISRATTTIILVPLLLLVFCFFCCCGGGDGRYRLSEARLEMAAIAEGRVLSSSSRGRLL